MREQYLDLLESVLTYSLWPEPPQTVQSVEGQSWKASIARLADKLLRHIHLDKGVLGLCVHNNPNFVWRNRATGLRWPVQAHTMVGKARLHNIRQLCDRVVADNVPGAFLEAGVWRGGASIMARACLPLDRKVICCDSFDGLPYDPAEPYWCQYRFLKVSENEVGENFRNYGLTTNVHFFKGRFSETLPHIREPLAILRCDGDMYSSTMDILENQYHHVSPGGYIIIDDYGQVIPCRDAVTEFRKKHNITTRPHEIDQSGIYWQKS